MFRAIPCSSSGGQIVLLQHLVSSLSVNGDDTRCCDNTICPPEDEHGNARNMSRIIMQHVYCYIINELWIKLVIERSVLWCRSEKHQIILINIFYNIYIQILYNNVCCADWRNTDIFSSYLSQRKGYQYRTLNVEIQLKIQTQHYTLRRIILTEKQKNVVIACIFTIEFVAYLYTKTPRGISGHLCIVWIIVIFISCIRPLLGIMPIPCTANLVLCHAPVWLWASTLDTQDKVQTHDLCVRSFVTRLVNYPVTLCILEHLCSKLHAVTFAFGARGASMHRSKAIKRLGIQLLWAFDHKLLPPPLLTVRQCFGKETQRREKSRKEHFYCCTVHFDNT
jgi:hypothetical protein